MAVSWECIVCTGWMVDEGARPVLQLCKCNSRVCQSCRAHVDQCPMCRTASLGKCPDLAYECMMRLDVRAVSCPGCLKTISTRNITKHVHDCVPFLRRRLDEVTTDVKTHQGHYRSVANDNDVLRLRVYELSSHVAYLNRLVRHGVRPEVIESDSDTDAESVR